MAFSVQSCKNKVKSEGSRESPRLRNRLEHVFFVPMQYFLRDDV